MKGGQFHDQLNEYYLLKGTSPWSDLITNFYGTAASFCATLSVELYLFPAYEYIMMLSLAQTV
jgi:hypothetical protein